MTSKLADKVAVVTGGSAGIGLGIAKCFAQEGARVFITGRRQSELDKAIASIGGNAAAIQGDASNAAWYHSQCVGLAGTDAKLPEMRRKELAQSYGDRAIKALRPGKGHTAHLRSSAA